MWQKKRRAFTLIEIVVAGAVLSLLFTTVYKVYNGVTNSFKRSNWTLKTQSLTRNTLTYIREEIQRSSYSSIITPSSVTIVDSDDYKFRTNAPVAPDLEEHVGSAGNVAAWYICKPTKNVGTIEPGFEIQCTLSYQNKQLLYTRTPSGTAPQENTLANKVILGDVAKIGIRMQDEDPGSTNVARLFVLKVWVKHPDAAHFPNLIVEEETAAKIDILSTTLP